MCEYFDVMFIFVPTGGLYKDGKDKRNLHVVPLELRFIIIDNEYTFTG